MTLLQAGSCTADALQNDAFGTAEEGGAVFAPRLLRRPALPPHVAPVPAAAQPGATLITGGLGAIGTLLAHHLLAHGTAGAEMWLLGRWIDAARLNPLVGAQKRQHSSVMLTISMCDTSLDADVAALQQQLHLAGLRPIRLLHAAGVLKVSIYLNHTYVQLPALSLHGVIIIVICAGCADHKADIWEYAGICCT